MAPDGSLRLRVIRNGKRRASATAGALLSEGNRRIFKTPGNPRQEMRRHGHP